MTEAQFLAARKALADISDLLQQARLTGDQYYVARAEDLARSTAVRMVRWTTALEAEFSKPTSHAIVGTK